MVSVDLSGSLWLINQLGLRTNEIHHPSPVRFFRSGGVIDDPAYVSNHTTCDMTVLFSHPLYPFEQRIGADNHIVILFFLDQLAEPFAERFGFALEQ